MTSAPSTDQLIALHDQLRAPSPAADDAERIDRIRLFEELKSVIAAVQAAEAVAFDASQRQDQAIAHVPAAQQGRGIAAQVALARRVSPFQGARWLGWARIVTSELPATFAELSAGRTTEWRAMLVARETAVLSRDQRAEVDRDVAPQLAAWGDRRVEVETRRRAQRLDPAAAVARAARAAADRRVSVRPAPDAMCRLSALLPVAQGVAAYAALARAADATTAVGDERGRGQIMADTLVERLTVQTSADAVPVEVTLVVDESTLLGGGAEPALIDGHGPIPAGLARDLATRGDAPRWLRRLYRRPATGELVALDSRRREFTDGQRRFLRLRDQTCRTPYCDAPIRHADHVRSRAERGTTSIGNGQGLCAACNYAKQAPGWWARPGPGGQVVVTVTPTGHRYESRAPSPPGRAERQVERRVRTLLARAA